MRSPTLFGVAFLGFGVAAAGCGVSALIGGRSLVGVTFVGLGVAAAIAGGKVAGLRQRVQRQWAWLVSGTTQGEAGLSSGV